MFPEWEKLAYDFSLQVGDSLVDTQSLSYNPNYFFYKAWINAMDSVYWIDGTWRYRWHVLTNNGPYPGGIFANTMYIEGMGYLDGIFLDHPMQDFEFPRTVTQKVVCFKTKDLWLYEQPNPWNADCDSMILKDMVPLGIESLVHELSLPALYPSPVTNGGELHFNRHGGVPGQLYQLNAYDLSGRQIWTQSVMPGTAISIPYHLNAGLYLFRVTDARHQTVAQQKILIQ